jgi:hypothetical protein
MGEPHLDALALAPGLLEVRGADERSSDITSALVDASRNPALRCLWTAPGLKVAAGTVEQTAAVENRIPCIDPARCCQALPGWQI